MKQRMVLLLGFMISTTGCVTLESSRPDNAPSGMNRTHVNKDELGRVTQASEPITLKTGESERYSRRNRDDGYRHHEINPCPADSSKPSNVSNHPTSTSFESNSVVVEASVVSTKLWHSFTTDFHSPSFNNLKWNPNPRISGTGGEVNVLFGQDDLMGLMVGGGAFTSERNTNSQQENGFYVKEVTRTNTFWVHGGVRFKPTSWMYLQGLLGLYVYELKTEVNTNVPTYTYDGLSGHRFFGALGVGGGLESPWDYPLHLFAGARIWLPATEGSFYESAVGQVNAGLSYRF